MVRIKNYFIRLWKRFRAPKEYVHVMPGHGEKLWELDRSTWDLYELDQGIKHVAKRGCLYTTALNETNAIRKFNKMLPGKLTK